MGSSQRHLTKSREIVTQFVPTRNYILEWHSESPKIVKTVSFCIILMDIMILCYVVFRTENFFNTNSVKTVRLNFWSKWGVERIYWLSIIYTNYVSWEQLQYGWDNLHTKSDERTIPTNSHLTLIFFNCYCESLCNSIVIITMHFHLKRM